MNHSTSRLGLIAVFALLQAACFYEDKPAEEEGAGPAPPAANQAPTITMTPTIEVLVGRAISITPVAADADGDNLTFSASNRPAWLSFSTQSGVLSGTPAAGDVGSYDVTVTVSDGRSQSSGRTAITVAASANGRATLSWEAPVQRVDGSALTNLAGFKLYYGSSAANLNNVIHVADPGARSWVIENLTVGTWYFAASAYDQVGTESVRSNVASKVIA